jgi:uncharacterized membrane protein
MKSIKKINTGKIFIGGAWILLVLQVFPILSSLHSGDFRGASISAGLAIWIGLTIYYESKYSKMVKAAKEFRDFLDRRQEWD